MDGFRDGTPIGLGYFVVSFTPVIAARASGLHIELVKDYYAKKPDPGAIFMRGLRAQLESDGLIFYDE